ncbi:DUF2214 domain-containing protein [Falsiroseomonas selenitidurans]|uniref:DUF2214 domain-containing protein n=1 Tax=Falsiroseomonas selenitidurans TaxID=2716335 RepID=A0ABX1EF85_9PROT|nr:DUF2214 domain-containing protein [Falsiroseomonas selenitidurans]NKC33565.1 DUF2214 domain-containing protein [Falsiroseomonas selenitidurans]
MLDLIAASAPATALRGSVTLYLLVNAAHVLGIGLLVGAIATLDLRLLGAFRSAALGHLAPPLVRVAATGLGLAALTGLLLFSTRPATYLENPAFLAKLALLALALANLALLHAGRPWRAALAGGALAGRLRLAAGVSLAAWIGALLAGRWIGFLQ